MSSSTLSQLAGSKWLRIGILVIVVAAAAAVWLTRSGERPALAIAHMSFNEIETQLYAELLAIHGGEEVCSISETSTPDASGYSSKLAAEHENGLPSQRLLERFEELEHSFDQVDDYHLGGSSAVFIAYAEDRNEDSLITLSKGETVYANVVVMHALSGGTRGEDRWEVVHGAVYWICDPLE